MRPLQLLRVLKTIAMLSCCAGALSLWTPSTLAIPSHPVPHIDSVLPLSTAPGGAQFTLTVNGTDFVAASTVSWSATALATTFVSTQQLTAIVPAPLIAASGTGWITVFNPAPGGGTSNLAFLPVGNTSAHVNFALFPLTAGTSPVGVAQGDFNGDGKLDLVTTNYVAGNLSIFLGNGDGTFQAPQTISIGSNTNPVGIVAADFDGDGNLDLAIGYDYQNSHGVSVLLGNGNGTFQPNQDFAAGTRTYELVSGDFNGDGFADIAVTNYAGNRVEVLLGNGDGTLQTAVPYSVTASAFYVQEADLNGDGTLDLVVCGRDTGVISVLLGNGDGTFQGQSTYTAGTAAEDVAIADFDGDGIPDVIATGTTTMFFLKGVGDGTFLTAVPIPVGFGTFVIASGDFNSDGKLDLAVTKSSGGVGVLLGNGDGTFQTAQSFPGASLTYGIVIGNFISNGGLAIATTDFFTNYLDVLLQTVSISPSSINFGSQAVGVASGTQNFTITNSTSQLVNFTGITFTGANSGDFGEMDNCGSSLASGAFCTVQVTFTPGAAGARGASLSVVDDAPASPQTATVSGTGTAAPVVGLSATALAFPNESVGVASPSQTVTVTNTGNASLNFTSIAVAGTNAADFSSSNNCGTTLAASAMCTITATFTPSAAGARTAAITLTDNAADSPESIALSGQGLLLAPTATLSATSLTFAQQLVGSAGSAQAVTLTNNGNTALAITSIVASGTNAADFAVTNTCGASLAVSAHCSISATFTPASSGARSASIAITDNASGSPQSIALSGTAQDFSLGLTTSTATVTAGNAADLQLSVTPLAGFNQAIALSCSGAPASATCAVSPNSVTPSGSVINVTVTLVTSGQIMTTRRLMPPISPVAMGGLRTLCLAAFCIFASGLIKRRSALSQAACPYSRALLSALLLLAPLALAACTGTVSAPITPKTPAGTYALTITATSGSLTRTTTVNITVQ